MRSALIQKLSSEFFLTILIILLIPVILVAMIPVLIFYGVADTINWFRMPKLERIRRRKVEKAACLAFEIASDKKASGGTVLEYNNDHCIVRVCYGNTRPPQRTYFLFNYEREDCIEVKDYAGDKAIWR
jgi:hypothetical protein